jgi:hypothetical protein
MTGNSLIDYDMGDDYRSPRFSEPDPIMVGIDIYYHDIIIDDFVIDEEKEFEDIAVSKEELIDFINEECPTDFKTEIKVIKNECDHVILEQIFSKDEKVRYEMFYK